MLVTIVDLFVIMALSNVYCEYIPGEVRLMMVDHLLACDTPGHGSSARTRLPP
jgi:hypothetical protein